MRPAGPLPGQAVVVLGPALGLALDVVVSEDGHAQERSLLDPLLAIVAARDVWVADRNFCTTGLVFGIAGRGGFFVLRRHASTLTWDRGPDRAEDLAGRAGGGTSGRAGGSG
ncbi:MAG: Transposase domain protein [Gemmataceae bacterium]|nr:Transposase domain protein [Gemmataceae bacterium]